MSFISSQKVNACSSTELTRLPILTDSNSVQWAKHSLGMLIRLSPIVTDDSFGHL